MIILNEPKYRCTCGQAPYLYSNEEFGKVLALWVECTGCKRTTSVHRVTLEGWAKTEDPVGNAKKKCYAEWQKDKKKWIQDFKPPQPTQLIVDDLRDDLRDDPTAPPPDIIEEDTEAIQDGLDDIFHLEKAV